MGSWESDTSAPISFWLGRAPSLIPGPSLTPPLLTPSMHGVTLGTFMKLAASCWYLLHWIYQLQNCTASLACFQPLPSVWLQGSEQRQISTLPVCLRSHLTLRCLISLRSSIMQFSPVVVFSVTLLAEMEGRWLPSAFKMCFGEIGTLRVGVGAWKEYVAFPPHCLGRHSRICISAKFPGVADRLPVEAPHPLEPFLEHLSPTLAKWLHSTIQIILYFSLLIHNALFHQAFSFSKSLLFNYPRLSFQFYSVPAPASITVNSRKRIESM